MKPTKVQQKIAAQALPIIKEHNIVYLACEERVGKTLASLMIAEQRIVGNDRVLILTTKKAKEGWKDTLDKYKPKGHYTYTNYHQAHKIYFCPTLVILDECHNYLSAFPKPSKLWKTVRNLCKDKPIIFMSATPYAQGYQQLFNQFKLSSYNPWKNYKSALDWFEEYGIPENIKVTTRQGPKYIPQYNKVKPECFEDVKHLFVTMTRKEAGFEHEPEDHLHYVPLNDLTKKVYNILTKKRVIKLNDKVLYCDTLSKLRTSLHMLEGGTCIIEKVYTQLGNTEKIDYIKSKWGDSKDLVVMYNYIAERTKLLQHFKNATILQGTSNAEGTDLSMYKNLVIYSQDFRTAKYIQRRARQANFKRDEPINVHFLMCKNAISEDVYITVAKNKVNYTDKLYKEKLL